MPAEPIAAPPGWFRRNRGLKLLALGLAIASWYAIREATSFKALVKDVRLQILVNEGWAVLERSATDVDILFRGSQQDLRTIDRESAYVLVDLRERRDPGEIRVRLAPRDVRVASAARAESFEPREVAIRLDREGDRRVPVRADLIGQPPEGYALESTVCVPGTVTLHGASLRLESVKEVLTEVIDLAGRVQSVALDRRLIAPGENWTARMEPDRVRVEVKLSERAATRDIPGVPVRPLLAGDQAHAYVITPPAVTVRIKGRAGPLDAVDAARLLAFVDCNGLEKGQDAELAIRVAPPDDVAVVEVIPPRVRVEQR